MNKEMTLGIILIAAGLIIAAILGLVGNYYLQIGRSKKAKESKDEIILHQDSTSEVINKNITKTQDTIAFSTEKIIKEQKKIPKVSQTGKNNLYVEDGNTGNINVGDTYIKPPQRHVQKEDLEKIYLLATDKAMKIKVFSNESLEGNIFRDEILQALRNDGFINLVQGTIGINHNIFRNERLTVKHNNYGADKWIEVLANPQE